ncbi:VRR-NUC domain-containing protein [Desulfosporosinus fructosivorans]|uniref:VRR-NUC domain-containing protein n=1 Tax=Desulfosporosinus fructosivorans TaxID=2018669 RepID=UPI0018EEB084|nr:VRR-NUC domain-containing protein [Desulfosporosinus fructosivorans]
MREKEVEVHLRDRVKALGGKAYKFVSPGNSGVPDRLVCLPGGIKIFVEAKAPGKKPTALQKAEQAKLVKLGNSVFNLDSKAEVDKFIEYCELLIR